MTIGVFDSGVGGLSVLRALRRVLPGQAFVYLADEAHAPYGEKGDEYVAERSLTLAAYLCQQHAISALVVACNTATAAAIHLLRAQYPRLPIVGIEPALKPAVAISRTGHIGVLATRGTVESAKFRALLASLEGQASFKIQPADGLAAAIEDHMQHSCALSAMKIESLCHGYIADMGVFGTEKNALDTLVLGCTHYPLVAPVLQALVGPLVTLVDPSAAVAQHTHRLLREAGLLASPHTLAAPAPNVIYLTTGDPAPLRAAACQAMALAQPPEVTPIVTPIMQR